MIRTRNGLSATFEIHSRRVTTDEWKENENEFAIAAEQADHRSV